MADTTPFAAAERQSFTFSRELAFDETDKTHNAFSGCDITAYMGHKRIASLQGITVSVVCEVMPIYTFSYRSPRAFVKGKRAISGNLVFTQFDRHAVLKEAEAFRDFKNQGDLWKAMNAPTSAGALPEIPLDASHMINQEWRAQVQKEVEGMYALVASRALKFVDQIPPFDVTIAFVNESGVASMAAVLSVQLVNEGYGWTLDDLTSDMAVTYIARDVIPLTPMIQERKEAAAPGPMW